MTSRLFHATLRCALCFATLLVGWACGITALPVDPELDANGTTVTRTSAGRSSQASPTSAVPQPTAAGRPGTDTRAAAAGRGGPPGPGATGGSFAPPVDAGVGNTMSKPSDRGRAGGSGAIQPPRVCALGESSGDVRVTTQSDLESLRGCTHIRGNLVIAAVDVVDLSPLADLEIIDGDLQIGPPFGTGPAGAVSPLKSLVGLGHLRAAQSLDLAALTLTDVRGLDALTSVQRVTLGNLDQLVDASGLEALPWTTLLVHGNDQLRSLRGLASVVRAQQVLLSANPLLSDLSVLSKLQSADSLTLDELPALTNLTALAALQELTSSLVITNCTSLVDLSGLGTIKTNGNVRLTSNPKLSTVSPLRLSGQPSVLVVADDPELRDLTGLATSELAGIDFLQLQQLPRLTSVQGLSGIHALSTLAIEQCDALSDVSGLEAVTQMRELSITNSVGFKSLKGLSGLTDISGNMTLQMLPALTDLLALAALTRIGDTLTLSALTQLHTLDGLSAVTQITALALMQNPALQSLHGLERLAALDRLQINELGALQDLTALAGVTKLSELIVEDTGALVNFNGLHLQALGTLSLSANASLSTLTGLESVSSRLAGVNITSNPALVSLRGLAAVSGVDSAAISDNHSLPQCEVDRLSAAWQIAIASSGNNATASCAP